MARALCPRSLSKHGGFAQAKPAACGALWRCLFPLRKRSREQGEGTQVLPKTEGRSSPGRPFALGRAVPGEPRSAVTSMRRRPPGVFKNTGAHSLKNAERGGGGHCLRYHSGRVPHLLWLNADGVRCHFTREVTLRTGFENTGVFKTPLPRPATPPIAAPLPRGAFIRAPFQLTYDAMKVCDERISSSPLKSPSKGYAYGRSKPKHPHPPEGV